MFTSLPPTFLLASPDAALLARLEPLLATCGARVEVVRSLEDAMASIMGPDRPVLAVLDSCLDSCLNSRLDSDARLDSDMRLDSHLPGADRSMAIDRLLALVRADESGRPLSIVLISDTVTQKWIDRLGENVIDDLVLRAAEMAYWRMRIEMVLRNRHRAHELETFREAAGLNAQVDHLTGVYNRETILCMLFKETDRVQRMNGALSLVLLDLDDFGHWNSRLGSEGCDDLLCQVAARITRMQRSYDLLGRPGKDEFLLVLPGCSAGNAVMLAERMRVEVFYSPFQVGGESIRLSACFGIASSKGRSSVVVLREAEQALEWARAAGPETIQCFGDCPEPTQSAFLTAASSDGPMTW
ncbi:MAG: GGDEF domain-containing protein [Terracidiphilus sp.]